jgi:hypothetical protein
MPDDAISPTLAQALDTAPTHETTTDAGASPRIQLATPEEVDAYAPGPWSDLEDADLSSSESERDADPASATSAVDIDLPPREPASDVFILQDWVTLSGRAGGTLAQDESGYVDFSDYQDAYFRVEVANYTPDQAIALETSPAKMEGLFRSMSTIAVTAATFYSRTVRWTSATVPPARWIRFRTGNLFVDWTLTFRIVLVGLRSQRRFCPQPPDWVTQGAPRPFRERVRVIYPPLLGEPAETPPEPGEEIVHYAGPGSYDLPDEVMTPLGKLRRIGAIVAGWTPRASAPSPCGLATRPCKRSAHIGLGSTRLRPTPPRSLRATRSMPICGRCSPTIQRPGIGSWISSTTSP